MILPRLSAPSLTKRSTQEVFEDHLRKYDEDNFERDLELNYAADIVMLTCSGIFRGHQGLRHSHPVLERSLPGAKIDCFNKLMEDEFAFLEWRAKNHMVEVKERANSFVFEMGRSCFRASITKSIRLDRKANSVQFSGRELLRGGRRGQETAIGC